jgi:hypothetical protein
MPFSRLRLKKEPPMAGISNNEQMLANTEYRRKAPFGQINAYGGGGTAPSAYLFRYSIFFFFLSFFTYSDYVQHVGRKFLVSA